MRRSAVSALCMSLAGTWLIVTQAAPPAGPPPAAAGGPQGEPAAKPAEAVPAAPAGPRQPAAATSSATGPAAVPPANSASAGTVEPHVAGLIARLTHPHFAVRLEALSALESLGVGILPQLQVALQTPETDPEIKRRLNELVARLEGSVALRPTMVTLRCVDQPVRQVVAELAKQSGYKIELWPPANANDEREKRLITVELNHVTFWTALQHLCDIAGLTFQEGWYGNDQKTLRLDYGSAVPPIVCLDGPFRFVARGMHFYRNIDFTRMGQPGLPMQEVLEHLYLNMSVSVEPRLPLLSVGVPIVTEAIDDNMQSLRLPPANDPGMYRSYYYGHRGFMQQVQVSLRTSTGRRLKVLQGVVPVTILAVQRPKITVPKLAGLKGVTYRSGTTTIHIDDVSTVGAQTVIKMSITEATPRGQPDYNWMNSVSQRLEVQDDQGQRLQQYNSNWGINGNSLQGTFTYGSPNGGNAPAARLIYYDWVTMTQRAPFRFEDLPLP